jgi:hypothetical protein
MFVLTINDLREKTKDSVYAETERSIRKPTQYQNRIIVSLFAQK